MTRGDLIRYRLPVDSTRDNRYFNDLRHGLFEYHGFDGERHTGRSLLSGEQWHFFNIEHFMPAGRHMLIETA